MKNTKNLTKKLVESSIMIAFATVLSLVKLVDMPYGGSVTLASMLPILIVAYRHGAGMGLASGAVFALIQQMLGLNNLSYVTGWQSVLAVIILDYALAFTVVGLGGIFKGKFTRFITDYQKRQGVELATGMVFVCILRYLCHMIAGATVWAGLSIPTEAALIYSIGYNATYMLPETLVSALVCVWIGSVIDFSKSTPTRFFAPRATGERVSVKNDLLKHVIILTIVSVLIFDTLMIAPHLQNSESGAFDFSGLSCVNWLVVAVVSAIGGAIAAALAIISHIKGKKN